MANAKPEDEQTIRAEIKRYFYDVGDHGSAAALNSHLTALLKPGITQQDRQKILDLMDVYLLRKRGRNNYDGGPFFSSSSHFFAAASPAARLSGSSLAT